MLGEEKRLFDATVQSYQRSRQITQNQYAAGVIAKTDVITAQAQLQNAQSQQIALGVLRAQLEHARKYRVQQTRAAYDQTVAAYRQTVLTAFQQVEDELTALRILEQQDAVAEQSRRSADEAVTLTLNEYKAGTVAYTSVVTAQVTALNAALSLASIRESRLVASIALIQALGGGWSVPAGFNSGSL